MGAPRARPYGPAVGNGAPAKHEQRRHRDAIREAGDTPPHLPSQLDDVDPPDTGPTEENDL